jgi:putative membrane protein
MILEMFLWQKPIGLKTFRLDADFAKNSASLAANQGLYNGFLSAGLFWSLLSINLSLKIFFLVCVSVAGLYAGLTVSRKIFWVQAFPAIVVLVLITLNWV